MRVLVCGSRDFDNEALLFCLLEGLFGSSCGQDVIIEGEARGADRLAATWGDAHGIPVERYPADWDQYGKRAGYVRNQQMLDEGKPELVVAFYADQARTKGTAMMVDIARKAGVECWEIFS